MRSEQVVLYHYEGCMYCGRIEKALLDLNLHIEKRDILENPQSMKELLAARGLKTVPVLRVTHNDGRVDWMPESSAIVRFLYDSFGTAK